MKRKLRNIDPGRLSHRLPALALAGAFFLAVTAPALADFESAVAAYEDGRHREAQTKFEALAAAGDKRAETYLERIREKRRDGRQAGGAGTSILMDYITSIFDESDASNEGAGSGTIVTDAGPSKAARSREGASGGKPADRKPWSLFDQSVDPAPQPPLPAPDIATPQRRSIWSTVFHLPGDATVVGLQYVAQFLSADGFSRELQSISRHSDKIALSILAGFWWLAIIRVMIGIGVATGRVMKAATTREEQKRYG